MSDDVRDYRSLGEILRDAREAKDWSVDELHERTRIAPRMIKALESDDIDQFDSPIYARGFVRQLSGPLGLDADWLLTKLGVPERSADEPPAAVIPPDEPESAGGPAPPTAPPVSERAPVWQVESVRVRKVVAPRRGLPWGRIGLALLVVAVAVAAVVLWSQRADAPSDVPSGVSATPSAPAVDRSASARDGDSFVTGSDAIDAAAPDTSATDATVPETADDESLGSVEFVPPPDTTVASPERADARLEWNPSTDPERIAESFAASRPVAPPPAVAPPASEAVDRVDAEVTDVADDVVTEITNDAPSVEETVTRAAPARGGRQRNEVVESEALDRGLPSVVRGDVEAEVVPMRLVIRARSRVEIDVTTSEGRRVQRRLEAGEAWEITGTDHFLVRSSDPTAAEFELDGILREPPPRWGGGEWFLHRPTDNDPDR